VPWVELFTVFAVSHLVGDFVLQTEWQAAKKHGGLGADPEARRALFSHVLSYTLAFVPALIWIGSELDAGSAVGAAALVAVPHLIQDDGRLLRRYMLAVKHTDPKTHPAVGVMVDQSIHFLVLLLVALLIGD
jgi:Protein of unknown function (DUF3307)